MIKLIFILISGVLISCANTLPKSDISVIRNPSQATGICNTKKGRCWASNHDAPRCWCPVDGVSHEGVLEGYETKVEKIPKQAESEILPANRISFLSKTAAMIEQNNDVCSMNETTIQLFLIAASAYIDAVQKGELSSKSADVKIPGAAVKIKASCQKFYEF